MANSKRTRYETTIDMLPDEILNMIFNLINFHGHLRLSGVCTRWKNLIENDKLFLDNVVFRAGGLKEHHTIARPYKHFDLYNGGGHPRDFGENLQLLLKGAQTIGFGYTTRPYVNQVMPLCTNVKEVQLNGVTPDDGTVFTFNHSTPVKFFNTASTEFLERFDVVTEIGELELWEVPTKELMAKYAGVIKSLSLHFAGSLDLFENFQLNHLTLSGQIDNETEQGKLAIQSFFRQQAPYLKSIEIEFQNDFVFHKMLMLLKNLEKIRITSHWSPLYFNHLKILPKLKSLDYVAKYCHYERPHYLDITELVDLTELRVSTGFHSAPAMKLRIESGPLVAMEKLKINGFHVDFTTLKQIVQIMPGLKELECDGLFQVQEGADYSLRAATQFNKLKHLESFTETNQRFLNNNFLGKLSLPELHRLILTAHEKEECVENKIYGQRRMMKRINITTLKKLAKNCPKLLRLFGITYLDNLDSESDDDASPEEPHPFIFAQRGDAASKFRIVRPVQKTVDGDNLKFDYDSVESSSD